MDTSQLALTVGLSLVACLAFFGLPLGVIAVVNHYERRAQERLRRTGHRCMAWVRTYRRVSMTQHRVLFEIHFPTGPAGREYMLSGLDDRWLAETCALGRPVVVLALPEADTIAFADA